MDESKELSGSDLQGAAGGVWFTGIQHCYEFTVTNAFGRGYARDAETIREQVQRLGVMSSAQQIAEQLVALLGTDRRIIPVKVKMVININPLTNMGESLSFTLVQ
jgi:hypothetical protein